MVDFTDPMVWIIGGIAIAVIMLLIIMFRGAGEYTRKVYYPGQKEKTEKKQK